MTMMRPSVDLDILTPTLTKTRLGPGSPTQGGECNTTKHEASLDVVIRRKDISTRDARDVACLKLIALVIQQDIMIDRKTNGTRKPDLGLGLYTPSSVSFLSFLIHSPKQGRMVQTTPDHSSSFSLCSSYSSVSVEVKEGGKRR